MEIIEGFGLRKFGCVVTLDDFQAFKKKKAKELSKLPNVDGFTFAAMTSVKAFHDYAWSEGITSNVRCVFEKGDPEDLLRKIFRLHGYSDPDFAWNRPVTDSKGFTRDPFVGLQAAGWIAYEYYLDADRLLYSDNPSDRWALNRFESLQGNIILQHAGAPTRAARRTLSNAVRGLIK